MISTSWRSTVVFARLERVLRFDFFIAPAFWQIQNARLSFFSFFSENPMGC